MSIKYQKGLVDQTVFAIDQSIKEQLADKAVEYDRLLAEFAVSKCEHADAIREQLKVEKEAVLSLTDFYQKTLGMIKAASHDIETVEEHYGKTHLTGG
ncbi:MAG: hypothetical protein IKY23_07370 [Lachnospiraceae bacterium]|nr:hypothetical protein [Lachnospiraceae bacterium]